MSETIHFSPSIRRLTCGDQSIKLPRVLSVVFEALASRKGSVTSHNHLISRVDPESKMEDAAAFAKICIWRLRHTLIGIGITQCIETVWGTGYRLTREVILLPEDDWLLLGPDQLRLVMRLIKQSDSDLAEQVRQAVFGI